MADKALINEIYDVIRESTETEVSLTPLTRLSEDMGLSSMEFMILLTDLEDEFDAEIPVERLIKVKTVGDLTEIMLTVIA